MAFTWNETITANTTKTKRAHIDSSTTGAYAKVVNGVITELLNSKSHCGNYDGFTPSTRIVPNDDEIAFADGQQIYGLAEDFQRLATYCVTAQSPDYTTVYNAPHNPNYYTTVQSAPYQPVSYSTHCSSNNADKCSTHNNSK